MENASKALLMAGGMVLAILLLTILLYAWNLFSDYQSSDDRLADIENTAKFNQQFTNYDRDDVQGYELISLINQIVDYNERKTSDTKNDNKEKNNPIIITINMINFTERKKLVYGDENNVLITEDKYEDGEDKTYFTAKGRNNSKSSFESNVEKKLEEALNLPGGNKLDESKANKVAKNIGSIFHTETEITNLLDTKSVYNKKRDNVLLEMANTYIASTGEFSYYTVQQRITTLGESLVIKDTMTNNYYKYACMYYEYMQFKRAVFKCTTLKYNEETGRVSQIDFEFTGKIH